MDLEDVPPVTDGRALTTDRDRQHLARAGDVGDSEHYQAVSRVRRRIRENMDEDVELLHEHHPDLFGELRDIVCELTVTDDSLDEAIERASDALADLNRARSQREARRALEEQELSDALTESENELSDLWNAAENAPLESALEHIDAARALIVDEIENGSTRRERDENR